METETVLLVAIPLIWMAVAAMVVVACRMAAAADDRAGTIDSASDRGYPLEARQLPPSPYGRAAARQGWRAAHGLH